MQRLYVLRGLMRLFGPELARLISRVLKIPFMQLSFPAGSIHEDEVLGKLCSDLTSSGFNSFLEITYPRRNKAISLFIHVVLGSNFVQGLRWAYYTRFWSDYSDEKLSKFYQRNVAKNYCGYSKLNNVSWCKVRLSQFRWLNKHFSQKEFSNLTYFEFGGGTGLLPTVATYLGFSKAINYDLDHDALHICEEVIGKLQTLKGKLFTLTDLNVAGNYDVISCHQVIEHFRNPNDCVELLASLMQQNSVLLLSHGYKNPLHPGHIGTLSDDEISALFQSHGLLLLEKRNGIFFFKKIKTDRL